MATDVGRLYVEGGDWGRAEADRRRWYERGWRYSGRDTSTLDHGDAMGAPDAWYDGYLDRAAGRKKWSSLRRDDEPS